MGENIYIDNDLIAAARIHTHGSNQSISNQIKHWAKIGCLVDNNPGLPYDFIKNMLAALSEINVGNVNPYVRRIQSTKKVFL